MASCWATIRCAAARYARLVNLFAGLISLPVYILPYAFVFGTPMLMRGNPVEIILTTATAAAGVILNAYALMGDFKDRTEVLERIVVFVAAIMLIAPAP